MNGNLAKAALAFLERVQLQGSEVEAYTAVRQALHQLAEDMPNTMQALEDEEGSDE